MAALRKARGLTQANMGDFLGVTQQCYARYETGAIVPNDGKKAQIAKALGAAVEALWPPRRVRARAQANHVNV